MDKLEQCRRCSGRGWFAVPHARSTGKRGYATKRDCPDCEGTGRYKPMNMKRAAISVPVEANDV